MDPMLTGSNPTEGDGFFRRIKIRSTLSFGGEVKPSAPRRKILRLPYLSSNQRAVSSIITATNGFEIKIK
jgi:hypothetical protein